MFSSDFENRLIVQGPPVSRKSRCHSDMGIAIPETLLIWTSPVTLTLTLTQIAKVI